MKRPLTPWEERHWRKRAARGRASPMSWETYFATLAEAGRRAALDRWQSQPKLRQQVGLGVVAVGATVMAALAGVFARIWPWLFEWLLPPVSP